MPSRELEPMLESDVEQPRLSIPPALMISEPNSFAQYTLRERLPAIIQQAIADNALTPTGIANLETLATELFDGVIRPIQSDGGLDIAAWSTYIKPFQGNSWFDTPFYFAEAYFYRRILEAIAYFQAPVGHRLDPFAHQKHLSLEAAIAAIRTIATQVSAANQDISLQNERSRQLIRFLYLALWGNRVDLSLWSASESSRIRTEVEQEEEKIVVNHSHRVAQQLNQMQHARIDFIVDNAGFELVCDLFLADFLLTTQMAETVVLHLKPYPLFVSDAMTQDVHQTLIELANDRDESVRSIFTRLQDFAARGQLSLQDNLFWTAPLPFWEMPLELRQELAKAQLIVVKGDANYRRLVGDRHWPFTTPLEDIANYFPASFVALRTLKSQVAVGLSANQVEQLTQNDPQWLINGQWGVIHFV